MLLRNAFLNVKWSNIATNDTVYAVTRQIPWSQVITRRELSWLGHFFCLSDYTPAKIPLSEAAIRLAKDRLTRNDFIELVCPMGFLYVN